MKIFITTISLVLLSNLLTAQKQANVWHFGDGISIDFNSGDPVLQTGSQIYTTEGCSSYCDSLGNLLMYTNGGGREPGFGFPDPGSIWNRNHDVMYDMQGIEGGGYSAIQSSVIVEAPSQPNMYYVFTMEEGEFDVGATAETINAQPMGRGCRYFTVDMTLNGGLGGVVLADQPVFTPSIETICAIRHSNQNDYWILINHDFDGIGVYSLTSSGVQLSNMTPTSELGTNGNIGLIKASPDGQKVMYNSTLLDFNPSNGQFSNPITLNPDPQFNDQYEFSHNSRYVYEVSSVDFILSVVRFDLDATNIPASQEAVGSIPLESFNVGGQQMQLAPDGRIYFVANQAGGAILHRINCPNSEEPSLETNVFSFPGDNFNSLPNYPAWIFNKSDDVFLDLGDDVILCGGENIVLSAAGFELINWQDGQQGEEYLVVESGTYSVTATDAFGCNYSDTVTITLADAPNAIALSVSDTALCMPAQFILTNETDPSTFTSQQWTIDGTPYPNQSTVTFTPIQPGVFDIALEVSTAIGCTYDTLLTEYLQAFPLPQANYTTDPLLLEADNTDVTLIDLSEGDIETWEWTVSLPAQELASMDQSPTISLPMGVGGSYPVQLAVTSSNGCSDFINGVITVNELFNLFVPSAFTPNGDGINDVLQLQGTSIDVNNFQFDIFNRWGERVFSSKDPSQAWTGGVNGNDYYVPDGIYNYYITTNSLKSGERFEYRGTISIIR